MLAYNVNLIKIFKIGGIKVQVIDEDKRAELKQELWDRFKKKVRKETIAFEVILLLAFNLFVFVNFIAGSFIISQIALIIILVFMSLGLVRYFLTVYRVNQGWFGNNQYEARELFEFMRTQDINYKSIIKEGE